MFVYGEVYKKTEKSESGIIEPFSQLAHEKKRQNVRATAKNTCRL